MIPNKLLLIVILLWTTTGSGQEWRGYSSRNIYGGQTLYFPGELPIVMKPNTVGGYDYSYPGSRRGYSSRNIRGGQDYHNPKGGLPMRVVPSGAGGYNIYYPPMPSDCPPIENSQPSRYRSSQSSKTARQRPAHRSSN